MKKVAILQSNYIPWKGYFDIINTVDEFIIFDTAQYTKNDWRNRNQIKTKQGLSWLTIPVRQEKLDQQIIETKITDTKWAIKHWRTISQNYSKAKYFHDYAPALEEFYLTCKESYLSEINYQLIKIINKAIGIDTKITWSNQYNLPEGKTEKILSICQQAQANIYLSGPSAKNYINQHIADDMKIKIEWMDYSNYPEYTQLHEPFDHSVTILDLIFNEGPNTKKFMKSFN